jgi:hypothetical protein
MHPRRSSFCLSYVLTVLLTCNLILPLFEPQPALTQEPKDNKGLVTFVEGAVKKQKLQQEDWATVMKNSEVAGGDRVRTFRASRAELELARLDRIRMAPKTVIDILKLYEETKEQVIESQIDLQSGDLWANVSKKPANMKFSIGTPVAVAAITGTVFRMRVGDDSSAMLKVYNGEVVMTNAPESQVTPTVIKPTQVPGPHEVPGPREVSLEEWAIIVKSMQQIKIDKKGQVVDQGNFTQDDQDEQTEWVHWNLSRDSANK